MVLLGLQTPEAVEAAVEHGLVGQLTLVETADLAL
jgi:hypothetical protein